MEEREGLTPDQPNFVSTRLGLIASTSRVDICGDFVSVQRTKIVSDAQLNADNSQLKHKLHKLQVQDEVIHSSRNENIIRETIESNDKVVYDRYEIPVP